MKTIVYNQEGIESGQITLPKEIFELEPNTDLINQAIVSGLSNRRQGSVKTKGRGEVSGGGRKPWRQKGTGRARQGSIRSPLWKGGGVVFATTAERNYKKKINKKASSLVLKMLLSFQAKSKNLIVVSSLRLENNKTKLFNEIKKAVTAVFDRENKINNRNILFVLDGNNKTIHLAARNIDRVGVTTAMDLNILDVVNSTNIVLEEGAIKTLSERLAK